MMRKFNIEEGLLWTIGLRTPEQPDGSALTCNSGPSPGFPFVSIV